MDVTRLWKKIELWLEDHAPVTAANLSPAGAPVELDAFERDVGLRFPTELKQWWSCCGGSVGDSFTEVIPPFYTPYAVGESWRVWSELRDEPSRRADGSIRAYQAGSGQSRFHPAWIPIAGDGFADELIVDLRSGPLHGCVMEWEQEAGRVGTPVWSTVETMLADIHRALTEGVPAGYCRATVTEDGRLDWQIR